MRRRIGIAWATISAGSALGGFGSSGSAVGLTGGSRSQE
jgi:hypothetical protein